MSILVIQGDEYASWDFQIVDGRGRPEDLSDVDNAKLALQLRYPTERVAANDGYLISEVDATITDARQGILQVTLSNPTASDGQPLFRDVLPGPYRVQVRLEYPGGALRQVAPAAVLTVRDPFGGVGPDEG